PPPPPPPSRYKREAEKSTKLEKEVEVLKRKLKEASENQASGGESKEDSSGPSSSGPPPDVPSWQGGGEEKEDGAHIPDIYDEIAYSQKDADSEAKEDDSAVEEMLALDPQDLKKAIGQLQRKIKLLVADMDVKLSESKQFQQMKRMMQDKNKLLSRARQRLKQYEPDYVDEQDM
ncbi:hypothetical protein TeGR_g4249, partial [Tetraparma gracilis]